MLLLLNLCMTCTKQVTVSPGKGESGERSSIYSLSLKPESALDVLRNLKAFPSP